MRESICDAYVFSRFAFVNVIPTVVFLKVGVFLSWAFFLEPLKTRFGSVFGTGLGSEIAGVSKLGPVNSESTVYNLGSAAHCRNFRQIGTSLQ